VKRVIVIAKRENVCEIFNDYFINVAADMSENYPPSVNRSVEDIVELYKNHPSIKIIKENVQTDVFFTFRHVMQQELLKKLQDLKPNKSPGYDNLPPKLIKLGTETLSHTLMPILNACLDRNIFPEEMKYAEVPPAYKKKNRLLKENYHPISVLSCLSKVFEGILCDQYIAFVEEKLSKNLAAYRKGHNSEHVLIRAIEDCKKALDNGEYVATLLIDLSKAFDSMPHGLLLAKVRAYSLSIDA
jgi:hypothetical protein